MRIVLAAVLAASFAGPMTAGASAASPQAAPQGVPLPAPKTSAPPAGKTCHVGGFTGVMMPGSTVCLKVGGFVRAQTSSGGGGNTRP